MKAKIQILSALLLFALTVATFLLGQPATLSAQSSCEEELWRDFCEENMCASVPPAEFAYCVDFCMCYNSCMCYAGEAPPAGPLCVQMC